MTTEKITLAFNSQQLDYIAQVLAQRPYGEVAALMADIQQQVSLQQQDTPPGESHEP